MTAASTKGRGHRGGRKPATKRPARSAWTPSLPAPREIWLAGLGVVVAAGETTTELVDDLVRRGKLREPKVKAKARGWVRDARKGAEGLADDALDTTRRAIDRAVKSLGVENPPRNKNILHRLGDLAEALL